MIKNLNNILELPQKISFNRKLEAIIIIAFQKFIIQCCLIENTINFLRKYKLVIFYNCKQFFCILHQKKTIRVTLSVFLQRVIHILLGHFSVSHFHLIQYFTECWIFFNWQWLDFTRGFVFLYLMLMMLLYQEIGLCCNSSEGNLHQTERILHFSSSIWKYYRVL